MITRCSICHGFTHADRACHYCGALHIMGKVISCYTPFRSMARGIRINVLPSARIPRSDELNTASRFVNRVR